VHHLVRCADTRSEAEYCRYLGAIAVPLGDREARLALAAGRTDDEAALRGFVRGRNDTGDAFAAAGSSAAGGARAKAGRRGDDAREAFCPDAAPAAPPRRRPRWHARCIDGPTGDEEET